MKLGIVKIGIIKLGIVKLGIAKLGIIFLGISKIRIKFSKYQIQSECTTQLSLNTQINVMNFSKRTTTYN